MTAATVQTPTSSNGALPMRRVGSLTLGICLIAAGGFLFVYFFVPQLLDGELVFKAAPAVAALTLCLLGVEVLYSAYHPGKMKCDVVAVLMCLLLIAACGCLCFAPKLWDELGPRKRQAENQLAAAYVSEMYAGFEKSAPEVALRDVTAHLGLYSADAASGLEDLPGSYDYLLLNIELYGPYEGTTATADFAEDCFALLKVIKRQNAVPTQVVFSCDGQTQSFSLGVQGEVQMDWSAAELAKETSAYGTGEEDSESTAAEDGESTEEAE